MADKYLYRTAITRLDVPQSDAVKLHDLIDAWHAGCAIATDYAWGRTTSRRAIQSATYDTIREETGLKSEHAILVCHRVAEALSSLEERRTQGQRVSKPSFRSPTVAYDGRTMTLFEDWQVSLTTLESRAHCDLVLPADSDGFQYRYLADDAWSLTESTLTYRDERFYLHLGFRRLRPEPETPEHETVLGVDLGIEQLAVTSTGRFFSGREFTHEQREAIERQRELQLTGTRSAYRTIGQVRARSQRYGRDYLHRVANGIIEEAMTHDCSAIAFEDLTGIRSRLPNATVVHRWAFRTLLTFVQYRAKTRGLVVETIDPHYTSQRCSRTDCGHTDSDNRLSRDEFRCQSCGYELNADYNAAKNIAIKYVRRGHTSSRRTGVSQCALASGTLSLDGYTDRSVTD